ncbi:glycosyltransferase family 2 protein [Thalassococcus sp. CAU 1522]|uniref:Glycosyltransferase family 2 protein n=1 Tax=Thalassococcus arenae TaxID=2851652 RepID=A0ABS6N697_9RHOB|nr:glycosyltransferase family 2 protein [Thalassococcus arenae]MBV2359545.1 glycosyltransferase family 2 protein [Thalassococcus arenae]
MADPVILTVLLNYRTPHMTIRAARAALVAMEGLTGELVIVDNDSRDGSFETIQAAIETELTGSETPVRLIAAPHNGGFGAGNNVGIRAGLAAGGKPDFVYILNSDAFPERDAIRRLLDHLRAHPEVGFAGSYLHGPDGDDHVSCFRFPGILSEIESAARFGPVSRLLRRFTVPLPVPDATRRVDWLAGASMLARQSVLDQIGLFDETFFLYFEETDLSLRAMRAGYETHYVRDSVVTHIGGESTGMKVWKRVPQYWLDSRWHYYSKNHGRAYAALATLAHVGAGLFWRLRRLVQRKPQIDPDHFLRDLVLHDARALFRALPTPQVARTPSPLQAETKS